MSKEDQSRNTLLVTVMPYQEKITVESYATSRDYSANSFLKSISLQTQKVIKFLVTPEQGVPVSRGWW